MENILILDTETTSLDPDNGKIIEIASIMYNVPTRSILYQASALFYSEENEAYEINKIEVEALKKCNEFLTDLSLTTILSMAMNSDFIIAHNAEFDKKWINTLNGELKLIVNNRPWICTKNDVIWPVRKGTPLNLIHICADMGVPIINTHRALSDCQLLLSAIEKVDDIKWFLEESGKGRNRYLAKVSYEQRHLAKERGFKWDNDRRVWWAKLFPNDADNLPFLVFLDKEHIDSSLI